MHDSDVLEDADEILAGDWLLVVPEALRAASCPGVTALHDVTEGGVGEALYEMARASGLAIEVQRSSIPVLPATTAICGDLGIDPLGLIGSGSLIVGCDPEGAAEVESQLSEGGIPFTWIGRAVLADEGSAVTVPRFPRDELIKTTLLRGIEAVIFDMDGTLVDSSYDWPAIRSQRTPGAGSEPAVGRTRGDRGGCHRWSNDPRRRPRVARGARRASPFDRACDQQLRHQRPSPPGTLWAHFQRDRDP
jgi:hypothetical protein